MSVSKTSEKTVASNSKDLAETKIDDYLSISKIINEAKSSKLNIPLVDLEPKITNNYDFDQEMPNDLLDDDDVVSVEATKIPLVDLDKTNESNVTIPLNPMIYVEVD